MSTPDYWSTPEGLASRAGMVANSFVYGGHAAGIDAARRPHPGDEDVVYAPSQVEWMLGESKTGPCEVCTGYAGTYDTETDLPDTPGEVHPDCACWLQII